MTFGWVRGLASGDPDPRAGEAARDRTCRPPNAFSHPLLVVLLGIWLVLKCDVGPDLGGQVRQPAIGRRKVVVAAGWHHHLAQVEAPGPGQGDARAVLPVEDRSIGGPAGLLTYVSRLSASALLSTLPFPLSGRLVLRS
jgi:hypothetical protein